MAHRGLPALEPASQVNRGREEWLLVADGQSEPRIICKRLRFGIRGWRQGSSVRRMNVCGQPATADEPDLAHAAVHNMPRRFVTTSTRSGERQLLRPSWI
jgi:hypothetical protein